MDSVRGAGAPAPATAARGAGAPARVPAPAPALAITGFNFSGDADPSEGSTYSDDDDSNDDEGASSEGSAYSSDDENDSDDEGSVLYEEEGPPSGAGAASSSAGVTSPFRAYRLVRRGLPGSLLSDEVKQATFNRLDATRGKFGKVIDGVIARQESVIFVMIVPDPKSTVKDMYVVYGKNLEKASALARDAWQKSNKAKAKAIVMDARACKRIFHDRISAQQVRRDLGPEKDIAVHVDLFTGRKSPVVFGEKWYGDGTTRMTLRWVTMRSADDRGKGSNECEDGPEGTVDKGEGKRVSANRKRNKELGNVGNFLVPSEGGRGAVAGRYLASLVEQERGKGRSSSTSASTAASASSSADEPADAPGAFLPVRGASFLDGAGRVATPLSQAAAGAICARFLAACTDGPLKDLFVARTEMIVGSLVRGVVDVAVAQPKVAGVVHEPPFDLAVTIDGEQRDLNDSAGDGLIIALLGEQKYDPVTGEALLTPQELAAPNLPRNREFVVDDTPDVSVRHVDVEALLCFLADANDLIAPPVVGMKNAIRIDVDSSGPMNAGWMTFCGVGHWSGHVCAVILAAAVILGNFPMHLHLHKRGLGMNVSRFFSLSGTKETALLAGELGLSITPLPTQHPTSFPPFHNSTQLAFAGHAAAAMQVQRLIRKYCVREVRAGEVWPHASFPFTVHQVCCAFLPHFPICFFLPQSTPVRRGAEAGTGTLSVRRGGVVPPLPWLHEDRGERRARRPHQVQDAAGKGRRAPDPILV
jgi:hypothetical protein